MKVLFVCTGNICRSPSAEGVLRHMSARAGYADRMEIDSCGIGGWHVGEPPDRRSQEHAQRRGYDLSDQRARKVRQEDFERFDHILAMDGTHLADLQAMAPNHALEKVRLFMEFAPDQPTIDVPDPYYGGANGFEQVLDLVEAGCRGLMREAEIQFR